MSYLLEKKLEHEAKCEDAIREERHGDAVFHAAKAAEFAYALAKETDESISKRYIADAEGWLEIAERLKENPPKKTSKKKQTTNRKLQTSDDEQGESSSSDWLVTEKPNITFDDIAGMDVAKQSISEMVIYPLKQPDKARSLGLKPGGGVILFGPPGNGKTMLGKAIANELDAPFYYASGAQIRSKWHGESEQRLRQLIQEATSNPISVIFFDEVEGLLPKRGGNSVVDNRIVTQFLAEIGGFEDNDNILLLLGATNCPWDIDEAVFRTGRFDEKIFIGLPDKAARAGILDIHVKDIKLEEGFKKEDWVERFENYTGSDIVGVVNSAKRSCLSRSVKEDSEPVVLASDFENALKNIPSSVTSRLMKKYADFNEARF